MDIFEQLPHTADIKIRVFGKTKQELFKHAFIGMFQVIGPHADNCKNEGGLLICPDLPIKHDVAIVSPDCESLLVDFLSEALWFSDVHNEAYLDVEIHEFCDTEIKATLYGVKVTGFDVVEMKAVTYHDLYIKQVNGAWQAEIVFDI